LGIQADVRWGQEARVRSWRRRERAGQGARSPVPGVRWVQRGGGMPPRDRRLPRHAGGVCAAKRIRGGGATRGLMATGSGAG